MKVSGMILLVKKLDKHMLSQDLNLLDHEKQRITLR